MPLDSEHLLNNKTILATMHTAHDLRRQVLDLHDRLIRLNTQFALYKEIPNDAFGQQWRQCAVVALEVFKEARATVNKLERLMSGADPYPAAERRRRRTAPPTPLSNQEEED